LGYSFGNCRRTSVNLSVPGIGLAGAGFGALMSKMIGVSVPNSRIEKFHQTIEKREILLMVDVLADRVDEIDNLVRKHHPEAEIEGTEPTIHAFPWSASGCKISDIWKRSVTSVYY
jgi:hypothetical protein